MSITRIAAAWLLLMIRTLLEGREPPAAPSAPCPPGWHYGREDDLLPASTDQVLRIEPAAGSASSRARVCRRGAGVFART